MPAPAMQIWKKQGTVDPELFDVQDPEGAMHMGLTLGAVRQMALSNKWAVEWPNTPEPPHPGPPHPAPKPK